MAELKLGTKFECFRCGTKFYDLGKSNPLCPKCGADQREAGTSETFAATQAARRKRKAEVVRAVPVEEEEAVVEVEPIDEELAGAELAVDEVEEDEEEAEDAG
jgi:uncharacterized protein (TIGR02300 family)